MGDFRKLQIWQRAHRLTLNVYHATSEFPKEQQFGLTSQVRRAAASIGANIAEGCGRNSDAELARFLGIAVGSSSELEYHLLLARDLGYLQADAYDYLSAEAEGVSKMLATFVDRLRHPNNLKPIANSQ
jgi:four helix bundle protein